MTSACIVEVALNGVTPKELNPHVPRTPAEVAADALACIAAGASIVHNHTDDVLTTPDGVHAAAPYVEAWRPVLDQHPDVLLYPTMASGGPGTTVQRRWAHHEELVEAGVCRVGLVDPGSVSLGMLGEDGLPLALDLVYENTHADARYMVQRCADLGLAPSVSIFDPSFLRVALAFHEAGVLPPGTMVKLYFGERILFGLPPTEPSLDAYVAMLEGTGLAWSVAVLGGDVVACGLARAALDRGGHVRVGLEDFAGDGTPTNVELVAGLVAEVDRAGRSVATPTEALRVLGLA